MESDYGELVWRVSMVSMESESDSDTKLAKSNCSNLCDLCHIVICSWTWPFFMSKVTKSESTPMHSTLCSPEGIGPWVNTVWSAFFMSKVTKLQCTPHMCSHTCMECFLFAESYIYTLHHTTKIHILPYTTNTGTWTSHNVFAHIGLNTPVLVRSPKLSRAKSGQYLGGRPPGNTGW